MKSEMLMRSDEEYMRSLRIELVKTILDDPDRRLRAAQYLLFKYPGLLAFAFLKDLPTIIGLSRDVFGNEVGAFIKNGCVVHHDLSGERLGIYHNELVCLEDRLAEMLAMAEPSEKIVCILTGGIRIIFDPLHLFCEAHERYLSHEMQKRQEFM